MAASLELRAARKATGYWEFISIYRFILINSLPIEKQTHSSQLKARS